MPNSFAYNYSGKKPLPMFGGTSTSGDRDSESKESESESSKLVPFADPLWYQGYVSPYYTEKHAVFRAKCRNFVEKEIKPNIEEWEEFVVNKEAAAGKSQSDSDQKCQPRGFPKKFFKILADNGFYGLNFDSRYGGTWDSKFSKSQCQTGLEQEKFDIFYELIWLDELSRCGAIGISLSVQIVTMALPPILTAGPDWMRQKVGKEALSGEKIIALAITEGWAGSDVAQLRTTAEKVQIKDNLNDQSSKSDSEWYYKINGQKKWITTGMLADYFTVAVRTGSKDSELESGSKGVSLILIERNRKGVRTEKMDLQGNWSGGTAVVTFNDVLVPISNLIGEENKGFGIIMKNFNHERFVISAIAIRAARNCLEESIKRARSRRTFGKPLKDSQVIRHKIAKMAIQIEQAQSFCETVAYQMQSGEPGTTNSISDDKLGKIISLLKYSAGRTFKYVALEASQIFGGLSYTRRGVGGVVERAIREMVSIAIPGGSEEILLDLSMKLAKL